MPTDPKFEIVPDPTKPPNEPPSDLQKIVDQSKTAVAEAAAAPRKRGPYKPRQPKSRPAAVDSSAAPIQGASPGLASTGPVSPPPDVTQYLVPPIQALSKIPAARHGIPELALTAEEAGACAHALNECVKAFVPDLNQMSPKTAAVMGAVMVFGSIGFTKYQIYLEKKPREAPKPPPTVQDEIARDIERGGGVSASDFLSGQA